MIKFLFLSILIALTGCNRVIVNPIQPTDKIVAVGDSLTFGYGGQGVTYPEELSKLIQMKVINQGISGDTSAQVLARIDDVIEKESPSYVFLAIGGNDMLRRVSDEEIKKNISNTIDKLQAKNITVVLIAEPRPRATGMLLGLKDATMYKDIASEKKIVLISDSFTKFLNNKDLKSDLIHLNGQGYKKTAENIAEALRDNKLIVN